MGHPAPPGEGLAVVGRRRALPADGAFYVGQRERYATPLERRAEEDDIGQQVVGKDQLGDAVRVDEGDAAGPRPDR